jgi:hypothetical protein
MEAQQLNHNSVWFLVDLMWVWKNMSLQQPLPLPEDHLSNDPRIQSGLEGKKASHQANWLSTTTSKAHGIKPNAKHQYAML